jgi:hypothetical protein
MLKFAHIVFYLSAFLVVAGVLMVAVSWMV